MALFFSHKADEIKTSEYLGITKITYGSVRPSLNELKPRNRPWDIASKNVDTLLPRSCALDKILLYLTLQNKSIY